MPPISRAATATPTRTPVPPAYSPVFGVLALELVRTVHLGGDFEGFLIVTFGTDTYRTKVLRDSSCKRSHNVRSTKMSLLVPRSTGEMHTQVVRQGRRGRDWREKLLLLVKASEKQLPVRFALYEQAKFKTDNALVGYVQLPFTALYHQLAQADKAELSAPPSAAVPRIATDNDIYLPLTLERQDGFDEAVLQLRGSFVPYPELRRAFWLKMAEKYGVGDPGTAATVAVLSRTIS